MDKPTTRQIVLALVIVALTIATISATIGIGGNNGYDTTDTATCKDFTQWTVTERDTYMSDHGEDMTWLINRDIYCHANPDAISFVGNDTGGPF